MASILIIDDDHKVCNMLSDLLNQMEHNTVCRHTLGTGLKEIFSNPYDLVLLDVNLPDGNGLDIVPEIRKAPASPEVIVMTGYGDEDGAETAIKSGSWSYILKTDSPQKILLPLKLVLQYREALKKARILTVALNLDGIVGSSSKMKSCFDLLAQATSSDANVLVTGETGTGKELFALAIHNNSKRMGNNFVIVDCASLPETLVESALFGHKKGAFTSADREHEGMILQAHKGTLFLDEVGELPYSIQKVFLRVLQEHQFRPVGSQKEVKSDFRLIAATNRSLDHRVKTGQFRRDLLYRLQTLIINLPSLRERPEDIEQIALYHVAELCNAHKLEKKVLSPDVIDVLSNYSWPGNVRELVKTLEAAITAASQTDILFQKHLPEYIRVHAAKSAVRKFLPSKSMSEKQAVAPVPAKSLKEFRKAAVAESEMGYLKELVILTRGDTKEACRISGLSRSRFYSLIKAYNISIPA